MTVQRAHDRARTKTRRELLREALLPSRPMVTTTRRPTGWRTETYGPLGLGTHRDPAMAARRWSR